MTTFNRVLLDAYRRHAVGCITQIMTNAGIEARATTNPGESKAPQGVVTQGTPIGAAVCMWDLYHNGNYVGWVRFEFGPHMDIQSNIKSLAGIEEVIHHKWCQLPKAPVLERNTNHFTAWIPGSEG